MDLDVSAYLVSLEEVSWGIALIAITMAMHGLGVILTLRAGVRMRRLGPSGAVVPGMIELIVATWILVLVHLCEVVLVWAGFLWLKNAFDSLRDAVYYALMQYTTVGSELTLPDRLRLLGGMIAMAGLLTFAWSTSVLFTLAQAFQKGSVDGSASP